MSPSLPTGHPIPGCPLAFCKVFSWIPHWTIFSTLKYASQIPYLGAYLSALHMVMWGIPFTSIGPTSQKSQQNLIFVRLVGWVRGWGLGGGRGGGADQREGDVFGKTHFLTSVSIDPWTKNPLCAF